MNHHTLKKLVKDNKIAFNTAEKARTKFYRLTAGISDTTFIKAQYKNRTGKKLNLDNPSLFNEKIQWLKINWRDDIATKCADKFSVREYVKDKVGSEILNDLYGVYDSPEEINFDSLPNSFVLKVTHGWGEVIICRDKNKLDIKKTKKILKDNLKRSHYLSGREWVYKNIKPRIICEQFLEENNQPPKDYKFFCFNGEPKIIQIDEDRFNGHARNIYDIEWNQLDLEFSYKKAAYSTEKPKRLIDMIYYAKKLSEGFPFMRVDLFYVNNKIYFGELTFYPENGTGTFYPESYNKEFGDLLILPATK